MGRLQRSWTAEDGSTRSVVEVMAGAGAKPSLGDDDQDDEEPASVASSTGRDVRRACRVVRSVLSCRRNRSRLSNAARGRWPSSTDQPAEHGAGRNRSRTRVAAGSQVGNSWRYGHTEPPGQQGKIMSVGHAQRIAEAMTSLQAGGLATHGAAGDHAGRGQLLGRVVAHASAPRSCQPLPCRSKITGCRLAPDTRFVSGGPYRAKLHRAPGRGAQCKFAA
jgi:hypothetical protein